MAPQPIASGKFIVFEGPDGVGKSTAVKSTAEFLRMHGHEVVLARLPGGTPVGEVIRSFFKTNASALSVEDQIALLLLAKRQLLADVIKPALARGAFVISDRFTDSLFAYQWAGFSKFCPNIQRRIEDGLLLYGIDVETDVKIVMDCPLDVALRRMGLRNSGADSLDDMDINYKRRVRSYYRDHMRESSQGSTLFVNAVGGIDDTFVEIQRILRVLLLPAAPQRRRVDAGRGLELQLVA